MIRKAKIYIPAKTAMQSGKSKRKTWILEFDSIDHQISPLMGWESSNDTLKQVRLKFSSKENAIEYANSNDIAHTVIEPKQKKFVIKSYEDNFTKD